MARVEERLDKLSNRADPPTDADLDAEINLRDVIRNAQATELAFDELMAEARAAGKLRRVRGRW